MIIIRNNLTVFDAIFVQGNAVQESVLVRKMRQVENHASEEFLLEPSEPPSLDSPPKTIKKEADYQPTTMIPSADLVNACRHGIEKLKAYEKAKSNWRGKL